MSLCVSSPVVYYKHTTALHRVCLVGLPGCFLDALLAEASASSQPVNFHVLIWMPRAALFGECLKMVFLLANSLVPIGRVQLSNF